MNDEQRRVLDECLDLIESAEYMSDPDVAAQGLAQKGFFDLFSSDSDDDLDDLIRQAHAGSEEAKAEVRRTLLRLKRKLKKLKAFW